MEDFFAADTMMLTCLLACLFAWVRAIEGGCESMFGAGYRNRIWDTGNGYVFYASLCAYPTPAYAFMTTEGVDLGFTSNI
jgi:hypothetical protein